MWRVIWIQLVRVIIVIQRAPSLAPLSIARRVNPHINLSIKEIHSVHGFNLHRVLQWNYVSLPQVHVVIVGLSAQDNLLSLHVILATEVTSQWAPGSCWEVELSGVLVEMIRIDAYLEGVTNHKVLLLIHIFSSHAIFTVREP